MTKPIDWGAIPREFLLLLDRMVDHGFVIEDFGGETGTLVLSSSDQGEKAINNEKGKKP